MVDVQGVHKRFGRLEVLRGIDLEVQRGEVMVILGPSGSGKSTLLRCINHLEKIDAGRISVDGNLVGYRQVGDRIYELKEKEVAERRAEVGMVFQRFNLFPHMKVIDNIMLAPMMVRGVSREAARKRALELLESVGLPQKADEYPSRLSGGQQQRVAIARALCMNPNIMLFDEPTSALDPEMVKEVLDTMVELASDRITMLVVSHEMGFARQVADRMIFMADGQILEINEPKGFFDHPQHERTRLFLQQILR